MAAAPHSKPALRHPPIGTSEAATALLERVRTHVRVGLHPQVEAIDRQGAYPRDWLLEFGALGGFAALTGPEHGGNGLGLATQIEVMAAVGGACGATAFTLWCQGACAWYLRHSPHAPVRERYLAPLVRGRLLAGSGMSNTVKHLAGIERHFLQAAPDGAGWRVSGSLPWVSNIGPDHVFASTAQLPDGGYLMFIVHGDARGVTLKPCPEFCALEGTRTLNVRFDDVRVAADAVLALPHEFEAFCNRIRPGFILLQAGIALGVIDGCLGLIDESNLTRNVTNIWLDDQPGQLAHELAALRERTRTLALLVEAGNVPLIDVLRARLAASELALRAAQSSALHAGARGYLMRHGAQRRTREALFVAIVTPSLKQLRHDIARLEGAAASVRARDQHAGLAAVA